MTAVKNYGSYLITNSMKYKGYKPPKDCEDCQHHSVYKETIGDFGEKMVMEDLCSLLPKHENISREEPKGVGDNCPLINKGQ